MGEASTSKRGANINSGGFWEGKQISAPRLCLRLSQSCLVCKTSRSSPPAFSLSEEVFSEEKASFLPPLALLGYVPIPTFCSYCVQTPRPFQSGGTLIAW